MDAGVGEVDSADTHQEEVFEEMPVEGSEVAGVEGVDPEEDVVEGEGKLKVKVQLWRQQANLPRKGCEASGRHQLTTTHSCMIPSTIHFLRNLMATSLMIWSQRGLHGERRRFFISIMDNTDVTEIVYHDSNLTA